MKQEIFLETLPKYIEGRYKGKINWKECNGYKVKFIYDNIEGWIEIINYIPEGQQLIVKYNNKNFKITTSGFIKCKLGKIIGKVTSDFKIKIGTNFKDKKRNITITDREYRQKERVDKLGRKSIANEKWYNYRCNKCSYEGWIIESSLLEGSGCACCCSNPHVVIKGINDIATTHSHLIKYFKNIEDAYTYTYASHKKVWVVCPDCGFEKEMKISDIYKQGIACPRCSSGIKYPEKIMFNILEQLGINFQTQLSKTTFDWIIGDKRYDFYFELNNKQYIIETHGKQHYEDCTWNKKEDVQSNDRFKQQLALQNGINPKNYIVINCKESTLKWIKPYIFESYLSEIFDLSVVDWVKCEEFATISLMKQAWDLKKNNDRLTTLEIGNILGLTPHTISKYLAVGNKLNYCDYRSGQRNTIPIAIYKDKSLIGLFQNAQDIEDVSETVLGFKLLKNGILLGKNTNTEYKGLTFKDIDIKYEDCVGFISNNLEIKYINPCAKQVVCIDTEVEYEQIKIASKKYGTNSSNIILCCKGIRNSAGKMRWLYKEDYIYMIGNNYSYDYIKEYIKEKYNKEEIN